MSSSDSDFEKPKKSVAPHKQFLENAAASRKKGLFQDMLARNANSVAGPVEKDKRAGKGGPDQNKSLNKEQVTKTHLESEDSSSDDERQIQMPSTSKADDSSSSWDSDSKSVPTGGPKVAAKSATSSDLTSDSEDDDLPPNQESLQRAKKVARSEARISKVVPKTADASSEFTDSEDEALVKKPQIAARPSNQAANDTSDSDEDTIKSPRPVAKTITGNGALKQSRRSSSISEDYAKFNVKTNVSNNNISESSDEDERPKKIQVIENIAFIPTPKKSPKVSGNKLRLKKEVSSSEDDKYVKPDITNAQMKQYMSAHGLIDVTENTGGVITDADDVYLIRVPKTLDPTLLLNSKLHFDRPSKLKTDEAKYKTVVEPSKRRVCLLQRVGGQCTVGNVEIGGTITYNEVLKTLPTNAVDLKRGQNVGSTATPLPELKTRHPLFGSSFEDDIKLPEGVLERIKHLVEKQRKWKLKNTTASKRELDVAEDKLNQDIFNLLREHSSKKDRITSETTDGPVKKAINMAEKPSSPVKKTKVDDSSETNDLEKRRSLPEELPENDSNITKRKKKKKKSRETCDEQPEQIVPPMEVTKKKKKKKHQVAEEEPIVEEPPVQDEPQKKHKKKKKHKQEEEVVEEEETATKSKKKKRKRDLEESAGMVEEDITAIKKKKKKRKREKEDC